MHRPHNIVGSATARAKGPPDFLSGVQLKAFAIATNNSVVHINSVIDEINATFLLRTIYDSTLLTGAVL